MLQKYHPLSVTDQSNPDNETPSSPSHIPAAALLRSFSSKVFIVSLSWATLSVTPLSATGASYLVKEEQRCCSSFLPVALVFVPHSCSVSAVLSLYSARWSSFFPSLHNAYISLDLAADILGIGITIHLLCESWLDGHVFVFVLANSLPEQRCLRE